MAEEVVSLPLQHKGNEPGRERVLCLGRGKEHVSVLRQKNGQILTDGANHGQI